MKLDAGRVEPFLKAPSVPVVLVYGPDAGMAAARGLALARTVDGAMGNPFRFVELQNPPPDALLAEAYAAALTGGRRVVRVRDARETLAKAVEELLKAPPEALIILEAGELTPKSRLRGMVEKAVSAAALACYAIAPERLPQIIAARLRDMGVRIEPEAATWAGQNLSGDEGMLAQALEVLRLYAGEEKSLALEDVTAILADGGGSSMGEAIDEALTGDLAATDRALSLAFEEGVAPVGLIRMLLSELMRLRVAASAMAEGASAQQAMAGLKPPVFFKRQAIMTKALRLWKLPALEQAIAAALAAETACKTTHVPEHEYCRQTLLALAMRARNAGRR